MRPGHAAICYSPEPMPVGVTFTAAGGAVVVVPEEVAVQPAARFRAARTTIQEMAFI